MAVELTPKEALESIAPRLLQEAQSFTASLESSREIDRRDDEFHTLLTSGCPSRRLHEISASLKLALRRYERLFVAGTEVIERSASEHEEIAERLINGDVEGCIAALKANWNNGTVRLLEVVDAKTSSARS